MLANLIRVVRTQSLRSCQALIRAPKRLPAIRSAELVDRNSAFFRNEVRRGSLVHCWTSGDSRPVSSGHLRRLQGALPTLRPSAYLAASLPAYEDAVAALADFRATICVDLVLRMPVPSCHSRRCRWRKFKKHNRLLLPVDDCDVPCCSNQATQSVLPLPGRLQSTLHSGVCDGVRVCCVRCATAAGQRASSC
jgi:hypothetical protein